MPRVLNKHTATKEEIKNAIYCGRGSPWGNPYKMHVPGDRDLVCDLFEKNILPTLDVCMLKGRDLLCFCAPRRCHCDAILRKVNVT